MTLSVHVSTALVLTLCCALPAVAAESNRAAAEEARKHFQRSKELYDDGDFTGSLKELERSYSAVPNFKLLYNMGQTQIQQLDHAGALRSFRKFLLDGGSEVSEARRGEVLKEIDKLRTRVAELTILVTVEGAEVTVDDVIIGKSPIADSVVVNVGKRRVTATIANHFPATKLVDVAGLDSLTVKLDPQPMVSGPAAANTGSPRATNSTVATSTSTAAAPVASSGRFPVWLPWVATGLLAAGTVVSGVLALQASKDQTTKLGTYGVSAAQLASGATVVKNRALLTDVLLGVTGAAAIGSLLFTLLRAPDSAPATVGSVHFDFGPTGVSLSGQF